MRYKKKLDMKWKSRIGRSAAAGLVTVALVVSGSMSAVAAEDNSAETAADRVADAVNAHPLAVAGDLLPVKSVAGAMVSTDDSATIAVPESFTDPIEVTPNGKWAGALTGLTIRLPEVVRHAEASIASDGSMIGNGTDVTAVVQPLDGGLRVSTVIDSPNSPTSYSYELPNDIDVTLNADGSASLSRSTGTASEEGTSGMLTATIGQVSAPWASDANGHHVDTHYEVVGNELIQVVDHNQQGIAYPVVADPSFWWGWNVYLSNSVVGKLVKLILTGAAATVVAGRLVALVPGISSVAGNLVSLAGALLSFGAALLNQCNWNNKGVWVGHTWVTGVLPFVPTVIRAGYFCVPN